MEFLKDKLSKIVEGLLLLLGHVVDIYIFILYLKKSGEGREKAIEELFLTYSIEDKLRDQLREFLKTLGEGTLL